MQQEVKQDLEINGLEVESDCKAKPSTQRNDDELEYAEN